MSLAGIDYSMTCPCVCIASPQKDGDPFSIDICKFMYVTAQKKYVGSFLGGKITGFFFDPEVEAESDQERYDILSDFFIGFLDENNVKEVAIEDYAFAAKGKVFHIGENTGLLKYKMWATDMIVHKYAPTQVKKFATKSGNAKKEQMYEAFRAETNIDLARALKYEKAKIDSPIGDIVDAYFIAKCHYYLGHNP